MNDCLKILINTTLKQVIFFNLIFSINSVCFAAINVCFKVTVNTVSVFQELQSWSPMRVL